MRNIPADTSFVNTTEDTLTVTLKAGEMAAVIFSHYEDEDPITSVIHLASYEESQCGVYGPLFKMAYKMTETLSVCSGNMLMLATTLEEDRIKQFIEATDKLKKDGRPPRFPLRIYETKTVVADSFTVADAIVNINDYQTLINADLEIHHPPSLVPRK